jgi:hypothetical protein
MANCQCARQWRWKIYRWVVVVALVAATLVIIVAWPRNPARAEVKRLVFEDWGSQTASSAAAMSRLDKMGPEAFPYLGEMLLASDNSLARFYYGAIRPRLPKFVLRRLGAPYPPWEARSGAIQAVSYLGPRAARGVTCELCRALPIASRETQMEILACLFWSVPESRQAVQAISNFTASASAEWSRQSAGWWVNNGRLPAPPGQIPKGSPLGSDQLKKLLDALPDANAGLLGPILGIAAERGSKQPAKLQDENSPDDNDTYWERRLAIRSIEKFGPVDPLVVSSLQKLAAEPDGSVQPLPFFALARAKARPKGALLDALQKYGFCQFIQIPLDELAELGPAAREALPWIESFTSREKQAAARADLKFSLVNRSGVLPDWLPLEAIISACRVAPDQSGRFAPDLRDALQRVPWTKQSHLRLLVDLNPCDPALLDTLEAALRDGSAEPALAAAIILAHRPGDALALETLTKHTERGTKSQRLEAAYWLWKSSGDAKPFLSQAAAGLAGSDASIRRMTLLRLAELGPLARPLGAALQAALNDPDTGTRSAAGRALRKIAPDLMPPVHECP